MKNHLLVCSIDQTASPLVRRRGASLLVWLTLIGLAALLSPRQAAAAITCTIQAPAALNFVYVSGSGNTSTNNKIQSAIVATCQRNLATDPTSATLILGANGGLQPAGAINRALFISNFVNYNIWRNAACSQQLQDTAATRISIPFASTTLSPVTLTFDYWACIVANQNVSTFPAGLYTDSVTLFLRNVGVQLATSTIPVNITAPALCSISSGPSNIAFAYNAFGAADFKSSNFVASCTNSLPYSMDVSPVAGVVGGLRYQLGLADTAGSVGNIGPAVLARVGSPTGSRSHVINGELLASQAGATVPIVPQAHTLTITY